MGEASPLTSSTFFATSSFTPVLIARDIHREEDVDTASCFHSLRVCMYVYMCLRVSTQSPAFIVLALSPLGLPRCRHVYICIRPLYPQGLPASFRDPRRGFCLVNLLFWRKSRFRRGVNSTGTLAVVLTTSSRI